MSDTGNQACKLEVKDGAQVMLTTNINSEDRLVNGLVGKVMDSNPQTALSRLYVLSLMMKKQVK